MPFRQASRTRTARWALLAALLLGAQVARASTVTVVGNALWDDARVASVVGSPPDTAPRLQKWADDALKRLVAAYRAEGYTAARGWIRVRDDHVDLEIDEGRIGRILFRGPNPVLKLLLSQSIDLPEGVFVEDAVRARLAPLDALPEVRGAAWFVREGDEWVRQEIPGAVRAQVLVIVIPTVRSVGFDVGIGFDPIYGILLRPSWARPDLAAEGDHLQATATVAFPLQSTLFDPDPQPRWIYGDLGVTYRMRPLGQSPVAPRFGVSGALIQTPRLDRGLAQLMFERSQVRLDAVLTRSEQWMPSLGVFASQAAVLRTVDLDDIDPLDLATPPRLDGVWRFGVTGALEAHPRSTLIRSDLRPRLLVEGAIGWSAENEPYARIVGEARGALRLRSNLLLLGVYGGLVAGDVRIHDALRVGGRRQRAVFQDLYYSRAVVQAETDLRFKIVRDLQIGAIYQHSLFEDTVVDPTAPMLAWANAFGPGVHLVLVDQLSVDVYWAMGFAPPSYAPFSPTGKRFGQTLSLTIQSAY